MRPSVFAVSLAAALLMPGAAAVADPPWERGHEHEARGCKFEYKAGPHGFKEEYKCDGGPHYAGGPPPWAPAHGWRRKNTQYYERRAGYVVPDLGIDLGRCNRDVIGAVLGGAAGGAIGSRIGKGSDRTVATIGGTIVGVLIVGDRAQHGRGGPGVPRADPGAGPGPARGRVEQPRRRALPGRAARGLRARSGAHLPRLPHHRHDRGTSAASLWHRLPAAGRELATG